MFIRSVNKEEKRKVMKKRLGRFIGSDHMPVREKRKSVAETRGKHESVFERVSVNDVLNWICIAKFYSSH